MAAPNLVNVSNITGQTVCGSLTTSNQAIVTAGSEYVYKINTIIVSNIDGTNSADATVYFYDAGSTNRFEIAKTVTVPAKTTLVVIGKDSPIYLEEGDKIEGLASANSDLQIIISFEAMTD